MRAVKHKQEDFLYSMQLLQPSNNSYSTATQIPLDENPNEAATPVCLHSV